MSGAIARLSDRSERQGDPESGALTQRAIHGDLPSVNLDDAFGDGESEP